MAMTPGILVERGIRSRLEENQMRNHFGQVSVVTDFANSVTTRLDNK